MYVVGTDYDNSGTIGESHLTLIENGTTVIQIGMRDGDLKYKNATGTWKVAHTDPYNDRWVHNITVFNISVSEQTYQIRFNDSKFGVNTTDPLPMTNTMDAGWDETWLTGGDRVFLDDFKAVKNNATEPISGTVVDQNGDQVQTENITVEVWGVRESAFDTTDVNELERRANESLDEASETIPDEWEPDRNLAHEYSTVGEHYIVANSKTEWETGLLSDGVDPDPRLKFDKSEIVTLSCWDPHDSADNVGMPVDGSWQGSTDSCTFRIERLSPTGERLSSWTAETSPTYETFGVSFSGTSKKHEVYQAPFAPGFYRVTIEDKDSSFQVVFDVGGTEERAQLIKEGLEDQAGRLTDQADEIAQRLENDEWYRTTVQTDANGKWSADVPADVTVVQVQAYDVPAGMDPGANFSDVRTYLSAVDVNQTSILLSTSPTRAKPPASNVEVEVIRADATTFKDDPEAWAEKFEQMIEDRLNESLTEVESFYEDRLEEQTREALEQRYADLRDLILADSDLRDAYLELSQFDEVQDPGDLTDAQLREEIRLMRQAFLEHDSRAATGSPETDVAQDTISVEFPVDGEIVEASPEVVWSNGTVQNVSDDHWHVESSLLGSDSTLVIDEYPVGEGDAAVAKFRANLVTADGAVGQPEVSVANPQYDGDLPKINAIDVDTLRPGPDEPVTVRLRPEEGTGFDKVTGATAIAPNRQNLNATVTNQGNVQFTTSGSGYHFVRVKYQTVDGEPFTLSFRLKAQDVAQSEGPTIQLADTPYGETPIVGERLESARYQASEDGSEHTFVAITPAGEDIGQLDVKPGTRLSGDEHDLRVVVVSGPDEETVNRHVRVRVHVPNGVGETTAGYGTGAIVRADGDPVTQGGTPKGKVVDREGDKQTIEVITGDDGSVDVEVNTDPTRRDRIGWLWENNAPSLGVLVATAPSTPSAGGFPAPTSTGVGFLVILAGLATARRIHP